MWSRNLRGLFVSSLRKRTEKAKPADKRENEERSWSLFAGFFVF